MNIKNKTFAPGKIVDIKEPPKSGKDVIEIKTLKVLQVRLLYRATPHSEVTVEAVYDYKNNETFKHTVNKTGLYTTQVAYKGDDIVWEG